MSVADLGVPNPYPLYAGAITATGIDIGVGGIINVPIIAVSGGIEFPDSVPSPSALIISDSTVDTSVLQNYSGGVVQTSAGVLRYYKFGSWVSLAFTQTTSAVAAAASSPITLSTALPAAVRPAVNLSFTCTVNQNGASVLGAFLITASSGAISITGASGAFTSGQLAGLVGSVGVTYPVV